jgi:hypothetical protein
MGGAAPAASAASPRSTASIAARMSRSAATSASLIQSGCMDYPPSKIDGTGGASPSAFTTRLCVT